MAEETKIVGAGDLLRPASGTPDRSPGGTRRKPVMTGNLAEIALDEEDDKDSPFGIKLKPIKEKSQDSIEVSSEDVTDSEKGSQKQMYETKRFF